MDADLKAEPSWRLGLLRGPDRSLGGAALDLGKRPRALRPVWPRVATGRGGERTHRSRSKMKLAHKSDLWRRRRPAARRDDVLPCNERTVIHVKLQANHLLQLRDQLHDTRAWRAGRNAALSLQPPVLWCFLGSWGSESLGERPSAPLQRSD